MPGEQNGLDERDEQLRTDGDVRLVVPEIGNDWHPPELGVRFPLCPLLRGKRPRNEYFFQYVPSEQASSNFQQKEPGLAGRHLAG